MQSVEMIADEKCADRSERPLYVALPEPGLAMEQDAEWCVVRIDDAWREIRFHDYADLYSVPGLYERLFYDILRCDSPATVCGALKGELGQNGTDPKDLRVLDLGAGNGMVGEELAGMGVKNIVGVDIVDEAARAAERDRPDVYDDYFVTDMTRLSEGRRSLLETFEFNCLTCVAALGFGDIPPKAFAEAYNLVSTGGWIAFNIKERFLNGGDASGFSRLITAMTGPGILTVRSRRRYRHRVATNGDPLFYVAIVAIKNRDIPDDLLT